MSCIDTELDVVGGHDLSVSRDEVVVFVDDYRLQTPEDHVRSTMGNQVGDRLPGLGDDDPLP